MSDNNELLLPCPKCGEEDAQMLLYLSDGETVRCGSCEDEFTLASIGSLVARWAPILKWIESKPR